VVASFPEESRAEQTVRPVARTPGSREEQPVLAQTPAALGAWTVKLVAMTQDWRLEQPVPAQTRAELAA
jgi:hypothetical protein